MHAQVCALQWSRHEKEILSSHGFSQNQLCLWKYPSMVKVQSRFSAMQTTFALLQSLSVCSSTAAASCTCVYSSLFILL